MATILFTVGLMAFIMLIMAVGVIVRKQPLKGSCGGYGAEDCFCSKEGKPDACELPAVDAPRTGADGVTVYGASQSVPNSP